MHSKKTPVFFVLILGCLLSFYGYWMVQKERDEKIRSSFDEIVSEEASALQQKIDDYFDEMLSLSSFYLSSDFVSREEFRNYTERIVRKYQGVQALQWVPYVPADKRLEFEASVVKEGFPDFEIKELDPQGHLRSAGPRDGYFPVTYLEPFEKNKAALGFNFNSEKKRAEALSKAIKKKNLFVVPSLSLIQEPERSFFVSVLPVIHSDKSGNEELKGVLVGAFKMDVIVNEIPKSHGAGDKISCFKIFDVNNKVNPFMVFSSPDAKHSDAMTEGFSSRQKFEVNGHTWELAARPCPKWLQDQRAGFGPVSVLIAGAAATILFSLYLNLFIDRTKGIERAVALRTAELAEANTKISLSEQNFRGLVSNLPGAVYRCMMDSDWTMEFISDEIEKISGYPAADFLGNKVRTYASIIHEDDRRKVEEEVQKGIEGKKPFILEYRIVDRKGRERWVYEKGRAIFSPEGKVLYLDGAIFDITERKKLSEQLLQSRKMEAIGKLSGGIAHDFNNQLMVIIGYCDLLLGSMGPSGVQREKVLDIKEAAEKSSALVRQLLAFGRRQIVAPAIFELNRLIKSLENMTRTVIGETIVLELKLAADLKNVRMDQGQMEQVLLNMIVNARDVMPGGGRLEIETRNVEIREENKPDPELAPGDYILLTVKDNGAGMTEDVKARIFEPFFSTKPKHKGAGLGLATCYGIIRGAGGIIQAQSHPGQGAVFLIYIPASAEVSDAPKIEKEKKNIPSGCETILLIEDEARVRSIIAHILRNQGYRVLEFSGGEEAIQYLKQSNKGKIDLLLTDVIMPGMHGQQVAETVKELLPDIQVIFMSGYMEDTLIRHGIEENQINFLQKPCEISVLCHKVRDILDLRPGSVRSITAA